MCVGVQLRLGGAEDGVQRASGDQEDVVHLGAHRGNAVQQLRHIKRVSRQPKPPRVGEQGREEGPPLTVEDLSRSDEHEERDDVPDTCQLVISNEPCT
eukprot:gene5484-biopygen8756